jgi:hypothetical protein
MSIREIHREWKKWPKGGFLARDWPANPDRSRWAQFAQPVALGGHSAEPEVHDRGERMGLEASCQLPVAC